MRLSTCLPTIAIALASLSCSYFRSDEPTVAQQELFPKIAAAVSEINEREKLAKHLEESIGNNRDSATVKNRIRIIELQFELERLNRRLGMIQRSEGDEEQWQLANIEAELQEITQLQDSLSKSKRLSVNASLLLMERVAVLRAEYADTKSQLGRRGKGFDDLQMDFIQVPEGEFLMGCSIGDQDCFEWERPRHKVHITKRFEIGKHEVTQQQWTVVMGWNPSTFIGDKRPVEGVSWLEAREFVRRLSSRGDGYMYRLPTEAEWEYAARASSTDPVYGELDKIAWYVENSEAQTHEVGTKAPNAWGIYDMLGNVWEWCDDPYQKDFHSQSAVEDPVGVGDHRLRVQKGGSWVFDPAQYIRVSYRTEGYWAASSWASGFRCVRVKR